MKITSLFILIFLYALLAQGQNRDSLKFYNDSTLSMEDMLKGNWFDTVQHPQVNMQKMRSNKFDNLYNELLTDLSRNKIPSFFLDPCLDYSNLFYCIVSDHSIISLRQALIFKLSMTALSKLYKLSLQTEYSVVNNTCIHDPKILLAQRNKSTGTLIRNRYNQLKRSQR